MRTVLFVALSFFLAACASSEVDTQASPDLPSEELPEVQVLEDEDGPATVAEFVEASTSIIEARLVEVRPALRFYGTDGEAPDATTFEQVGLVFEPLDVFKGTVGEQIVVRWTAYTTEGIGTEARRVERVSINGVMVNEDNVGHRFGLFVGQSVGDDLFEPLTSAGIVPLDAEGLIQKRPHIGSDEDFIGRSFADFVASEPSATAATS